MQKGSNDQMMTTPPSTDNNPLQWYWGHGTDPEVFTSGPFDTREEAVSDACGNCAPGESVTLCYADKVMPSWEIFDHDMITERYQDQNEECVNDDGNLPGFNPTDVQVAELVATLDTAFKAWLDKYKLYRGGWAFNRTETTEYIEIPDTSGSPATGTGEA